jgi:hypothetical protein
VRANDADRVAAALGLRTVLPANWRAGLAETETHGVFVTPPVAGWVFAVGPDLQVPPGAEQEELVPLLERLAATFGEAAWFTTDAAAERHGWAFARGGAVHRGYAYDGDVGDVFWLGEVTDTERALGCFVADPRDRSEDEEKWWPDERVVLEVAAAWTLDPRRLPALGKGLAAGVVGRR